MADNLKCYNIAIMNEDIYDDVVIERIVQSKFGLDVDIKQVIVRQIEVSRVAEATVFLTKKKQLMLYVSGHTKLLLGDVKKIVTRMGLRAELYVPPKGQPDYFDAIGRDKFRAAFPGREQTSSDDILFYRTLAPYNPALVIIHEVKDGHIYQYDSDSRGEWRVAAKFAYRRIKTS